MDKPLKILMYSDHFGGHTTTFLIGDLKGLSAGNEITYACIGRTEGQFKHDDVRVLPYEIGALRKKIRWIMETRGLYLTFRCKEFARSLKDLIDEIKPDIIQCNFGYEALRLTDNLSEDHWRIPIVINFLGYDASFHLERNSYVRKLKEIASRKNITATCNTNFLKGNLERKGIVFRRNEVIYTGVDTAFFKKTPGRASGNEFVFLQIAIIAERKGQAVTLLAFKKFLQQTKDPSMYRLVIAGGMEAEYGQYVKKLPAKLEIEDQVVFHDWVTREQSRALMNNADCFVHHSMTVQGRTEGIPTAVSEAMSMELPVISTFHAGIPELVEHNVNGYLVKEGDVEDYASKMKMITDMGFMPGNRMKVIDKFNIEGRTAKFLSLYDALIASSAS